MGNSEKDVVKKLDIISKLLYMQTKPRIEELKAELIKTEKQQKVYDAIDANKTIKQIATKAGYRSARALEALLPEWEKKGIITSFGKGPKKRYATIENLIGE
jgi:predicted Rossmann fold nucleotide-binding protein DprA/Smf involved in DNA uptake